MFLNRPISLKSMATKKEPYRTKNFYAECIGDDIAKVYKQKMPHIIEHPARVLIIGPSGSGKTNLLMSLIHDLLYWDTLTVFAHNPGQKLLTMVQEKIAEKVEKIGGNVEDYMYMSSTIDKKNPGEDYDSDLQNMVIFDDMTKQHVKDNQKEVTTYLSKGRNKNISVVVCTQNYFDLPKVARSEFNYVLTFRLRDSRDVDELYRNYGAGFVSKEAFKRLYNTATRKKDGLAKNEFDPEAFLFIAADENDLEDKYRKGWMKKSLCDSNGNILGGYQPEDVVMGAGGVEGWRRKHTTDDGGSSRMHNEAALALVDEDDLVKVAEKKWRLSTNGYAETGKNTTMHRLLMDPPPGKVVDHINGNRLDNRKENLRVVTQQVNTFNRRPSENSKTKVLGVYPVPNGKYVAKITANGKQKHLGTFNTVEEASAAYQHAKQERDRKVQ